MLKKGIAMALSAAMAMSSLPIISAVAAEEVHPAAVSGYVSTENGVGKLILADSEKTPTIFVDSADFAGVIRAVGDLQADIKTVTDIEPTITNEIEYEPLLGAGGIFIGEKSTSVSFDFPVDANADCYIAIYNADGSLAGVKIADQKNEVVGVVTGYKCNEVIERPMGGDLKAFLWNNMTPIMSPVGIAATEGVNLEGIDVVVGTIGESKAIDTLATLGSIDVKPIEGKWESFTLQSVDDTLVIAGSDKRGTIYGIYDFCEKMGVSPWSFWADTAVGHADGLYIDLPDGGYTVGEPSVQYRGIFLNDEFNMTEWSKSMGNGNMGNETYEKLFELLLRLKANYLWPAMHKYSTAFNVTENNAKLADEYGIVMGSSHCEPLLRNNLGELYTYQQEWTASNPDKPLYVNTTDDSNNPVAWKWTDTDADGNSVYNKEFIADYWRTRVQANGAYENTLTLGMRGVHDGKFDGDISALTEIISTQRTIIEEELCKDGKEISEVPQLLIPYKEILTIYNQGLEVPDDVTLMWPDDNFGYIRQLPTEKERERSGGAGIYYHLSYHGRPTSYLWLGSTQPGLIREEMTKAYDMGAQKIWVANVGDLKPAETEVEYFLDLAYDVDNVRNESIADRLADNAKRDFGFDDTQAKEYANIKLGYYEAANSRRPEHMVQGLYNLSSFGDEGQTLINKYADLEARAEVLYNSLDETRKPSLYELLLYPIKGAGSMAEKYIYADKAQQYADLGWGSAENKYAAMSDSAYDKVVSATSEYTSMLDSKWDKMMNPYQTGLRGSFGGPISGKLSNPTVSKLSYTNMQIVPEGGSKDLVFTPYTTAPKFVDIINTGTGSFDWEIINAPEWLVASKTSGTVADNDRIYISVDLSMPNSPDDANKTITFARKIGDTVVETEDITVTRDKLVYALDIADGENAYVEVDGYVSIEAEHYGESVANGEYEWKVEEDFGRSGDSVKIYPNIAENVTTPNKDNSAYLKYNVYFESSGTFPIDVYRMPTINELSGSTMRFAIGVDGNSPVIFNGNTKTTDNSAGIDAWGKGVLQNTDILSGNITVAEPGMHTIELYNSSAGVVIDKMVISTGTKQASYYGAPESYNTKYNCNPSRLPKATEPATEQTGTITPLFTPSMLTASVTDTTADIVYLGGTKSAIFAVAAFNNGAMTDATFTPFSFMEDASEGSVTQVEFVVPVTDGADEIQYMIITDDYEPIAPSVVRAVETTQLMASYEDGYAYPAANTKEFTGMEAVCVIGDKGFTGTDGIKYIRQSTVDENTYDKIPFAHQGQFDLKINVSGAEGIIEENLSTIINIETDTDAVTTELFTQNFDTEPENVTISGAASYDSANKAVNMGTGGSMTVDFAEPVTTAQGDTVTIVSKIAYGKLSGKYMDYTIKDSNGKDIVYSHITAYNSGSQLIKIGDKPVFEATSSLPDAIARNNSALSAGYTTYTTVIDYSSNTVTLTLNSSKGTVSYDGPLPDGTSYDIKQILFTNTYNNSGRVCYADDISISKTKAPSYTMSIVPTLNGESVDGAVITVIDGLTNAEIISNDDGTYNLCDGVYEYIILSQSGTLQKKGTFELSPATESKTITIDVTE